MSCQNTENLKNCNCSATCSRKGNCCQCLAHHKKKGQLPACLFPNDVERGYDRSVENFIAVVQERGTGYLMQ